MGKLGDFHNASAGSQGWTAVLIIDVRCPCTKPWLHVKLM